MFPIFATNPEGYFDNGLGLDLVVVLSPHPAANSWALKDLMWRPKISPGAKTLLAGDRGNTGGGIKWKLSPGMRVQSAGDKKVECPFSEENKAKTAKKSTPPEEEEERNANICPGDGFF